MKYCKKRLETAPKFSQLTYRLILLISKQLAHRLIDEIKSLSETTIGNFY